jgi:hypothetical protein
MLKRYGERAGRKTLDGQELAADGDEAGFAV